MLRAAGSPRRFDMLTLLQARRQTCAELADALGLPRSTAHSHLRHLVATGVVSRHDSGRLWVYYELTPMGLVAKRSFDAMAAHAVSHGAWPERAG